VLKLEELDGPLGGWIQNTIRDQGSIVLEPYLDKAHDLSIQIEIGQDSVQVLEARKFITGPQFEYKGTLLGPLRDSFDSHALRLLQEVLPTWKTMARDLGAKLRSLGYQGSAGIDAMIYRSPEKSDSQTLRLKPVIEINPRWTMGRVALELEKRILPGTPAAWIFVPMREISQTQTPTATSFLAELKTRYPLVLSQSSGRPRIESGVIATQDPTRAQEVLTLLLVGSEAFQWALRQTGIINGAA
jgi:hypothetical protein